MGDFLAKAYGYQCFYYASNLYVILASCFKKLCKHNLCKHLYSIKRKTERTINQISDQEISGKAFNTGDLFYLYY